jgi:aerobic carbon-monoxide dehydrogenase large subunit
MAQVVAGELGIPVEDVTVQHSDSLGTPFGYGTYGSRSAAVGTVAIHTSLQRIKEKARRIGAHMLEAPVDEVIYEDGKVFVKGSPASMKTIQDIAAAAAVGYSLPAGDEPFLDDTAYYDPPNCTYPFGTHACVVEVDADTGEVTLTRYVAVDDVGKVINPMIVEGQVHGGIAQGVAQALWEGASYDADGRLETASLMDYALPKAEFFPPLEVDRTETPTDVNALGVKGAGETGTIASTPAVVNAVVDALSTLGVDHIDAMPLTPERVWKTAQAAKSRK